MTSKLPLQAIQVCAAHENNLSLESMDFLTFQAAHHQQVLEGWIPEMKGQLGQVQHNHALQVEMTTTVSSVSGANSKSLVLSFSNVILAIFNSSDDGIRFACRMWRRRQPGTVAIRHHTTLRTTGRHRPRYLCPSVNLGSSSVPYLPTAMILTEYGTAVEEDIQTLLAVSQKMQINAPGGVVRTPHWAERLARLARVISLVVQGSYEPS